MKSQTADYPRALRINFASIRLAVALHRAKCQAFGPARMWRFSSLPPRQRQAWIEKAAAILREEGKPDRRVGAGFIGIAFGCESSQVYSDAREIAARARIAKGGNDAA